MNPPFDPNAFILEGVMTTLGPESDPARPEEGVNIAPMGPVVDPAMTEFVFRPFKTSTTYRNLKATGQGVFHVTDDALLIARAATRQVRAGTDVAVRPADCVRGVVLANACRYYELRVSDLDDREDRTTIRAGVVHAGRIRDFVGFHRARHAVLEAAILATRLHLTGAESILQEFARLRVIVDKTGTEAEHTAMRELTQYVQRGAPRE